MNLNRLQTKAVRMTRNLEAVSQFKTLTKRNPNRVLYRKISIPFRKISNFRTSSLWWWRTLLAPEEVLPEEHIVPQATHTKTHTQSVIEEVEPVETKSEAIKSEPEEAIKIEKEHGKTYTALKVEKIRIRSELRN